MAYGAGGGVRLGRDGLLEAGAFFEGADFFEAGAAGGVAADEGDYGGVGPDLVALGSGVSVGEVDECRVEYHLVEGQVLPTSRASSRGLSVAMSVAWPLVCWELFAPLMALLRAGLR